MSYILEVTDFARIQNLAEAFHRRGFVRIEDRTFEIKGYCPGPGVVPDSATFHLDLRRGVQLAPEVIITNLAGLSLRHRYDKPRGAPARWRGPEDGLPPVGTVCELRTRGGGWGEAEIKYHGRAVCVWLWVRRDGNTEQIEHAQSPDRLEFRPIRTPEQIKAEQRERKIKEAMDTVNSSSRMPRDVIRQNILRASVEALIDGGWDKFEIVDEQP